MKKKTSEVMINASIPALCGGGGGQGVPGSSRSSSATFKVGS